MHNSVYSVKIAMLFVGLFFALLCQIGLPLAEGLPVHADSEPVDGAHGSALCVHSPLLISTAPLLAYSHFTTSIAIDVRGVVTPGYSLPFYRPPRSTVEAF